MTTYTLRFVDGATLAAELTEQEWFQVFLTGTYKGGLLVWIERTDSPDKKVIFEENSYAPAPSKLA